MEIIHVVQRQLCKENIGEMSAVSINDDHSTVLRFRNLLAHFHDLSNDFMSNAIFLDFFVEKAASGLIS